MDATALMREVLPDPKDDAMLTGLHAPPETEATPMAMTLNPDFSKTLIWDYKRECALHRAGVYALTSRGLHSFLDNNRLVQERYAQVKDRVEQAAAVYARLYVIFVVGYYNTASCVIGGKPILKSPHTTSHYVLLSYMNPCYYAHRAGDDNKYRIQSVYDLILPIAREVHATLGEVPGFSSQGLLVECAAILMHRFYEKFAWHAKEYLRGHLRCPRSHVSGLAVADAYFDMCEMTVQMLGHVFSKIKSGDTSRDTIHDGPEYLCAYLTHMLDNVWFWNRVVGCTGMSLLL